MMEGQMDPHWPTAASWIKGAHRLSPVGTLGLLGAPLAKGSITPGRCDLAPAAIREAMLKFSCYDVRSDHDLRDLAVIDFGDLDIANAYPGDATEQIASAVGTATKSVDLLVVLGGDNSVTRPGCRGFGHSLSECALLTLDAHLDLRDLDAGPTNGNPVRGLLEDGLAGNRIVQIGIQAFANSGEYLRVARNAGIEVIEVGEARAEGLANVTSRALSKLASVATRIYVDVDLDVLDRAFSPATPGSRAGGFLPFELFEAVRVCGAMPKVAAVDFVEIDPTKDFANTTIFAAAGSLLSLAGGFRSRFGRD